MYLGVIGVGYQRVMGYDWNEWSPDWNWDDKGLSRHPGVIVSSTIGLLLFILENKLVVPY